MATATYIDVTAKLNANKKVIQNISGWDTVVIHAIGPSGTISLLATNDAGDVQGTTDGNASTATNFSAVGATKLADGTAVTAIAAAGLYKLPVTGHYLQIGDGATAAVTKMVLQLHKII